MAREASGMGSPGLTWLLKLPCRSTLPSISGVTPISTMRAFLTSSDVVSVSMTAAVSDRRGVDESETRLAFSTGTIS